MALRTSTFLKTMDLQWGQDPERGTSVTDLIVYSTARLGPGTKASKAAAQENKDKFSGLNWRPTVISLVNRHPKGKYIASLLAAIEVLFITMDKEISSAFYAIYAANFEGYTGNYPCRR